jgi:hypothetical protein
MRQKKWEEAEMHLKAALVSPSRRPEELPWVYFRLAQVAKELHDTNLLREAVDGTITADALSGGRTGASAAVRALAEEPSVPPR